MFIPVQPLMAGSTLVASGPQAPALHVDVAAQALAQMPQLASSVAVLVHIASQTVGVSD